MSRSRIHLDNAARQRAYRARQRAPLPPPTATTRRAPARPTRLQVILDALTTLRDEYEIWQYNLPSNLAESTLGARLHETVEGLNACIEAISSLDLPRGYGRD